VLTAALIWLGRDPSAASAQDVEDAFAAIEAIAPYVAVFDSAMMTHLTTGELCLVLGWSVDVISVQAEAHEGVALSYVTPREGGLIWVDAFALPSDAQALEAAHAFVDFMLRPENSAAAADHSWAPSAVTAARALMDPEIAEHPAVYPQSGAAARLRAVRPQRAVSKAGIALDWSRVKLGEAPWE
jgi:putrescine transport system substrate-binding protein